MQSRDPEQYWYTELHVNVCKSHVSCVRVRSAWQGACTSWEQMRPALSTRCDRFSLLIRVYTRTQRNTRAERQTRKRLLQRQRQELQACGYSCAGTKPRNRTSTVTAPAAAAGVPPRRVPVS